MRSVRAYPTRADYVYDSLRQRILSGEFKAGDRLIVDDLARELNVSNSPVRTAFMLLQMTGLVTIEPYRGTMVSAIASEKTVAEVFQVRTVLEELAVSLAAKRMQEGDLERTELERIKEKVQEYTQAFDEDDTKWGIQADRGFHDALAKASGNSTLAELLGILADRIQVTMQMDNTRMRRESSLEDHKMILQALQKGDADEAAGLVRQHITKVKTHVLDRNSDFGL